MSDSEQGLDVERCEYCGRIKPIKYFGDVETAAQVFAYLDEFSQIHGGPKFFYKCRECAIDIENKLEETKSSQCKNQK